MYNNNMHVFVRGNTRCMHSYIHNMYVIILNCDEITALYEPMCVTFELNLTPAVAVLTAVAYAV